MRILNINSIFLNSLKRGTIRRTAAATGLYAARTVNVTPTLF